MAEPVPSAASTSASTVLNPHDHSPSPHPNALPSPSSRTNQELAQLLSNAYAEIEGLRRELSHTKRRAEKSERLNHSLAAASDASSGTNGMAQPLPEHAVRIIRELEDRAMNAELARDEAEARRRVILDQWSQAEGYLNAIEFKAQETRQSFGRIIKDGGGSLALSAIPLPSGPPGTLTHITAMPPPAVPSSSRHSSSRHASSRSQGHNVPFPAALSLPPVPNTNPALRRPRTPSLDSAYPPSKRSRGNDDHRGREPRVSYSESHLQGMPQHALEPVYGRQGSMRVIHTGDKYLANMAAHSRSSSRSSASSMDVDEMLLRATTGDEQGTPNGAGASPNPHGTPGPLGAPLQPQAPQQVQSSHRSRRRHGDVDSRGNVRGALPTSDSDALQPYNSRRPGHVEAPPPYPASQSAPRKPQDLAGSQIQTYQTHIFAPPVTGAPIKKSKYSMSSSTANTAPHGSSGVIGSIDAPQQAAAPAPPVPAYPPTNAQGQRICRQCGQAGRYKEGKCVEKWGPGPMGPGTVCDRCRKKMKRVERRGTLETQQQLAAAASLASAVPPAQQHQPLAAGGPLPSSQTSDRSLQRSDTIPTHHASPSRDKAQASGSTAAPPPKVSHVRTIVNATSSAQNRSPPQPTSLLDEVPMSNVGRGSRVQSRSGSRNASRASEANGSAVAAGSHLSKSRSPADKMEVTDSDADAEAEAEAEAEILGAVEATTMGNGSREEEEEEGDAEADGDAEAELLEAVDAAEANSVSSLAG